jgi:hypothetical protein
MKTTIEIKELPNGEVSVHIKSDAAMVTTREDRYATEITKSIKAHLAQAMPAICKKVIAQERN